MSVIYGTLLPIPETESVEKPLTMRDLGGARVIDLALRRGELEARRQGRAAALTQDVLRELCGTDSSVRDFLEEIRNIRSETYLPGGETWDEIIWGALPDTER